MPGVFRATSKVLQFVTRETAITVVSTLAVSKGLIKADEMYTVFVNMSNTDSNQSINSGGHSEFANMPNNQFNQRFKSDYHKVDSSDDDPEEPGFTI